jgi:hypothetical protein
MLGSVVGLTSSLPLAPIPIRPSIGMTEASRRELREASTVADAALARSAVWTGERPSFLLGQSASD